jgi:hypothetical protein
MASGVYLLCAATALVCSLLLLRGYRRSGFRLLLWSSLCFTLLTLENLILFVDVVLVPDVDLRLIWNLAVISGVALLLYGLVWEGK